MVQIHGEKLSANEEDILRLFNKATFLELRILSRMDTDGVIQIIQVWINADFMMIFPL